MFLERFSLPKPDIRLITLNDTIYKIKLYLVKPPRHSQSHEQTGFSSNNKSQEDIEGLSSRQSSTVAKIRDCIEQFKEIHMSQIAPKGDNCTDLSMIRRVDMLVEVDRPDRKRWEIADKVLFYRHEKQLKSCPYVYSFYVEVKRRAPEGQEMTQNDEEHVSDSSENEDSQSLSLLDGCTISNVNTAEEIPETSKSASVEIPETHTKEYERTTSSGPTDVVAMKNERRKRHNEIRIEAESKKKRYSVEEYAEKNRHEVQEQDLQEQLRLQELASPEDEKSATTEMKETKFQRVISSIAAVKRLMFGSS